MKIKETGKTNWDRAFQTEGIQSCSTGQFETTDVFLSIKTCKPILVGTQNKSINLKINLEFCMSIYIF